MYVHITKERVLCTVDPYKIVYILFHTFSMYSIALKRENISQTFSTSEIIPCAGQGVIALQCRDNDESLIELLKQVDHQSTHSSIKAERNVLKVLEGDCETAVGAFANIEENKINLEVELFSLDGSKRFHLKSSESIDKAEELGIEMGKTLKKMSNNSYKK